MASSASAYFVAIPTSPTTHIQKMAPGPPIVMAVATPAIFPFPIVADNAVISVLKLEISPSDESVEAEGFSFVNASLNA